ncbi:hypothetical protein [Burkholderia phage vB_BpP_HN04]|uniref:Uncharacterized protein n=1 Tax=Burkholderia phage vB_BpP_HN02 TaxID=3116925 RepID=A0AAX4JI28_9CAUD|nr:hypothetical protein [Burkholderia phage vB_BpP_HN01]
MPEARKTSVELLLELNQMTRKYDDITKTGRIKIGTVAMAQEIVIKSAELLAATRHEYHEQNPVD